MWGPLLRAWLRLFPWHRDRARDGERRIEDAERAIARVEQQADALAPRLAERMAALRAQASVEGPRRRAAREWRGP